MTRHKLGRLEIVLPQSLKQQFFTECERRGYMPSRVLRLMMSEALHQWQTDDMNAPPNNNAPPNIGASNNDQTSAPRG